MATASLFPHFTNLAKASRPIDEQAILAGDKSAFEQLVHQESPRLYRMIHQIVQHDDEAQNVLQETFLQAYVRLSSFRGDAKLTTWLYSIGLNLARGARRKAAKTRVIEHSEFESLRPAFVKGQYAKTPREWDAGRTLEREEQHQLVHEAIKRLPEQHRTIVNLKDIQGWATEDVAELLNISTGAVRVRLHRARQALRALLAPYFSGALAA